MSLTVLSFELEAVVLLLILFQLQSCFVLLPIKTRLKTTSVLSPASHAYIEHKAALYSLS